MQQTGVSIREAFDQFHENNPEVYKKVEALAFKAIYKGKQKISMRLIIEVIRWEVFMETNEQLTIWDGEEDRAFKINNNYIAYYARKFQKQNPDHAEKLITRGLRA